MTPEILKRLHQRKPYLLIDEIISHSHSKVHAIKKPSSEEYYLQGHFPNAPIVPGAMMQEMTTQTAGFMMSEYYSPVPDYDSEKTQGHAIGVLRSIHQAKYKQFARPGDTLEIFVELLQRIDNSYRFKAHIEIKDKKIMFNEFTLINISDDKLKHS